MSELETIQDYIRKQLEKPLQVRALPARERDALQNHIARLKRQSYDRRKHPVCRKFLEGNCPRMYGGICGEQRIKKGCPWIYEPQFTEREALVWACSRLYPNIFSRR